MGRTSSRATAVQGMWCATATRGSSAPLVTMTTAWTSKAATPGMGRRCIYGTATAARARSGTSRGLPLIVADLFTPSLLGTTPASASTCRLGAQETIFSGRRGHASRGTTTSASISLTGGRRN
eukprot:UN0868